MLGLLDLRFEPKPRFLNREFIRSIRFFVVRRGVRRPGRGFEEYLSFFFVTLCGNLIVERPLRQTKGCLMDRAEPWGTGCFLARWRSSGSDVDWTPFRRGSGR